MNMDQNYFASFLQLPIDSLYSSNLNTLPALKAVNRPKQFENNIQHLPPTQGLQNSSTPNQPSTAYPSSSYKSAEVIAHNEHLLDIKNTPSYFLGLFLDEDVINWLMNEVNTQSKDVKSFAVVTEEEVRCFVAILYLTGYVEVPRRRMLWERTPDTHCALISNAMQRDRFESILATLHAKQEQTDKLDHIGALVEQLNRKFLQYSVYDDHHSIGQCAVPITQKHHKAKGPTKALKVWCGCTRSGYCVWFMPSFLNGDENNPQLGQSVILRYANIVRNQSSPINLLFENCYSQISLFCELQRFGIQGAAANRDKSHTFLNPPLGGVDKLDFNLNLYRTSIRGKKSFSALVTFCLDLALNNAWQLYRVSTEDKKPLDLLSFRRNVVVYYLQHYAKPINGHKGGRPAKAKLRGKRPPPTDARFDGIRHYVVPQEKQTRCGKCSAKTTTRCQKCDVGVHVKCFVEFHTRPRDSSQVLNKN